MMGRLPESRDVAWVICGVGRVKGIGCSLFIKAGLGLSIVTMSHYR